MEYLPREMLAALHQAQSAKARRKNLLRVDVGGRTYPVLRRWRDGFALDAAQVENMRGLVDLYDGARHLAQCLIIASEVTEGELICTIKRETAVAERAALDFERDERAAVALLPRE
jgi:hypothetical protein